MRTFSCDQFRGFRLFVERFLGEQGVNFANFLEKKAVASTIDDTLEVFPGEDALI